MLRRSAPSVQPRRAWARRCEGPGLHSVVVSCGRRSPPLLAVSRVRSAVWSHVGLAHEYCHRVRAPAASGRKRKIRPRRITKPLPIQRDDNHADVQSVFLDPALFRTDVEKHLAHAFRDAPDLSASTCVQTADLEGLSFAEQVSIMVGSAVVVAAHGAALTSIVWMRPKRQSSKCRRQLRLFGYFGSLAAEVGLRYVHRIDPKPRSICMKNGALDWSEPDEGKRRFTWPPSVSSSGAGRWRMNLAKGARRIRRLPEDLNISAAI